MASWEPINLSLEAVDTGRGARLGLLVAIALAAACYLTLAPKSAQKPAGSRRSQREGSARTWTSPTSRRDAGAPSGAPSVRTKKSSAHTVNRQLIP